MKKTKVCFYPTCENATNHFLANLARLLCAEGGFECSGFLKLAKDSDGEVYRQDVYHFNWFDQSVTFVSFVYRLYILLRLKLAGKKIVWTIHNTVPHGGVPAYNKILRFLLLRFSSVIHIMSEGSRKLPYLQKFSHKVILIPHGDYFGSYPDSSLDVRQKYGIAPDEPLVLFLGAIRPYKNIELLIRNFPVGRATLLICGGVRPAGYLRKLQECISVSEDGVKNKVILAPDFVPDDDLSAYVRAASFLVAPYSYDSALNSGTVLLACSYGKTMVCPDIAGVQDIQNQADCLYAYHYETPAEHGAELARALNRALDDAQSGELAVKEARTLEYMHKNSWQAHSSEWCGLYR